MKKVLVVDDDKIIREIVVDLMQSNGFATIQAIDGEDGEKKAKDEKPDLIILDVVMPKKNGYQICRDLKKSDEYKHIPVILLTAKDQDSDKFWGRKQGADEYLTKPFDEDELVKLVKKYIG